MSDLISRQAAIDEAEEWIGAVYCDREEQRERSAIKKVIQGIKALPSVQLATDTNVGTKLGTNLAEVGTDCISRQQAIDAARDMTAKEAIKMQEAIKAGLKETGKDHPYRDALIPLMKESCDMAIEALNSSEIPNSSDCIDRAEAQTAIQFAARRYTVAHEAHGEGHVVWSDNLISVTDAMNALREVPSAQSELIRCKDCKYSEHWYRDKTRCFLWHETGIDVFEDGYCNYAKRRTDADMRGEQDR